MKPRQTHKVSKGYSANVEYSSQLWFLQLAGIIVSGTFLLWGATTFMNVLNEKPTCSYAKSV